MESKVTDQVSVEEIRALFKRISEIQKELKRISPAIYEKFRDQNSEISDLEFYNLKKVIKHEDYQSIDTLEMRRALADKWEAELHKLKEE